MASRPESGISSAGKSRSVSSAKKSSNKSSKKKKIEEDPKVVHTILDLAVKNSPEALGKLVLSPFVRKFDFNQSAGEALCRAADRGLIENVKILLQADADADLMSGRPLQLACAKGHAAVVKLLIENQADPNTKAAMTEYTAVHQAARNGDAQIMRFLISKGANLRSLSHPEHCQVYNGWAPVHFAADEGHLECVQALVEADIACMEATTPEMDTPIAIAAERGKFEVVKWLAAMGANIGAKRRHLTAVQWAVYRAEVDVVQFLVSHGHVPDLKVQAIWFPRVEIEVLSEPPPEPESASAASAKPSTAKGKPAAKASAKPGSAKRSSTPSAPTPGTKAKPRKVRLEVPISLEECIKRDFSDSLYQQIDLAVYRGKLIHAERLRHMRLLNDVTWTVMTPAEIDGMPARQDTYRLPQKIIHIISDYEM